MTTEYNGDPQHIGMMGHSMGGRAIALRLDDSIQAAVLIAPAAADGLQGLADFMGGMDNIEKMYAEAKKDGKSAFTLWGEPFVGCSLTFFEENEAASPLTPISEYNGKLMVAVAKNDTAISPETYRSVIESAKDIEVLNVENANHIFSADDGSDSQVP